MKKILFLILGGVVACNGSTKKDGSENTAITEEQQLKNIVHQYPDSMLPKENLIQFYRDSGDYKKAILEVNNALTQQNNNARLWEIKAILHFEDEDTLKSIKAFEKALSILPNTTDMISLGTLYAQTKNSKAIILADTLLAHHNTGDEKQALFIKGLYYSFTNDKQKAISFFDKCVAIDFTYMDAYREKAIALYDLGKYNEAVTVLNKAITLQNNFDEGYYYRGRCYEKLNRNEEAIESYQTALMYSPDYTEAKEALSRLGVKTE